MNASKPVSGLWQWWRQLRHSAGAAPQAPAAPLRQRSSRAGAADLDWTQQITGAGGGWARPEHAHYYAGSVAVYAAVKLRADAVSRPPLGLFRAAPDGGRLPVEPTHPAARLLRQPNPWLTQGDLWRATEIHLGLWGSAYWALEQGAQGQPEIWPLRPDRVRAIPDRERHIKGFVYQGQNGAAAYAPSEMAWLRYFNPLDAFAGLPPLAPARLAADMAQDGMRFNRNFFRNSAQPDFVLLTGETMTDAEIEDFYARWEARYQGPGNAHRPAIASFVKDIKTLGLSHRDMDFIQGLRWSLEEVSRAYGVPKPLLGDFERAALANVNAAERFFWRNTIVPELRFIEEQINAQLLPRLGWPELTAAFDLSAVEALQEDEASRLSRQTQLLDRGALTINEVRRERGLPPSPGATDAAIEGVG